MESKKKNEDREIITGLEATKNPDAEYDLVASLLEAADFRNDLTTVEIRRNGKFLFEVNIHPVGDEEVKAIRKKATTMMPNPQNRKLPKIEKEFNSGMFNSLLIYTASTDEDRKNIWGNETIMKKYNLVEPYESIDKLLTVGEKAALSDKVIEISGMDIEDEEVTEEEYVKN